MNRASGVRKTATRSLLLVFVTVAAASAQVTTGTILGVVRDNTGGVLPGVMITIKNLDTGLTRPLITDAEGRYHTPNLPLGTYEIQAELSGFRTTIRRGIELTVGREAVVELILDVGEVAEEMTVTGDAPLVETTKAEIGGLVDQRQMRQLPLNARSYEQLALLQPNVYHQRSVFSTTNTGYTPKLSAAGLGWGYNA
jgi:hypothetical protein